MYSPAARYLPKNGTPTVAGESLVFTVRKPFDLIANGSILKDGRGGGIRTRDLYTPSGGLSSEGGGGFCWGFRFARFGGGVRDFGGRRHVFSIDGIFRISGMGRVECQKVF
jgi:hypothetical protein